MCTQDYSEGQTLPSFQSRVEKTSGQKGLLQPLLPDSALVPALARKSLEKAKMGQELSTTVQVQTQAREGGRYFE